MSQIAQSFASLVKSNNGLFKSEAQAKLLLSQCDGNTFIVMDTIRGKSYTLFYMCDQRGVVRVQKQTVAKGLTTTWERVISGQVAVQNKKEVARCQRQIKALEASIAERQSAWDRGEYPADAVGIFNVSMERERSALLDWKQRLASL